MNDINDLLTINQASDLAKVTRFCLYKLIKTNKLEALRFGTKLLRVKKSALNNLFTRAGR